MAAGGVRISSAFLAVVSVCIVGFGALASGDSGAEQRPGPGDEGYDEARECRGWRPSLQAGRAEIVVCDQSALDAFFGTGRAPAGALLVRGLEGIYISGGYPSVASVPEDDLGRLRVVGTRAATASVRVAVTRYSGVYDEAELLLSTDGPTSLRPALSDGVLTLTNDAGSVVASGKGTHVVGQPSRPRAGMPAEIVALQRGHRLTVTWRAQRPPAGSRFVASLGVGAPLTERRWRTVRATSRDQFRASGGVRWSRVAYVRVALDVDGVAVAQDVVAVRRRPATARTTVERRVASP